MVEWGDKGKGEAAAAAPAISSSSTPRSSDSDLRRKKMQRWAKQGQKVRDFGGCCVPGGNCQLVGWFKGETMLLGRVYAALFDGKRTPEAKQYGVCVWVGGDSAWVCEWCCFSCYFLFTTAAVSNRRGKME